MRSVHFSAAVLLSIAAASLVTAETIGPTVVLPSDEMAIRDLELKSWAAWKNHDAAFFEWYLSADHVEVHAHGIVGRTAVIDGVRSSACVVQSYSLGPFSLTPVSGDVVLVTYRAEQKTSCGDIAVPSPVWATSLYAKRAGQWLNILYEHTPVARS
jgi:Domain of unknown function (DUF4440)